LDEFSKTGKHIGDSAFFSVYLGRVNVSFGLGVFNSLQCPLKDSGIGIVVAPQVLVKVACTFEPLVASLIFAKIRPRVSMYEF
jgi:hypothetical protein